jgi:hypothetical protein
MAASNYGDVGNSMGAGSPRTNAYKRFKKLETDRSSWRSHWIELSDYVLPRRGRFLMESPGAGGRKRNNKIIDSTASGALRTMAAGMMSGMSSPARPWHRRTVADKDLRERSDVRKWLGQVEQIERSILNKSNFYNVVYNVYKELGVFGTAPLYRQKNFEQVIRFRQFTAGEYVIAENDQGIVDTLGREFQMTVHQIVGKFVHDKISNKMNWHLVSSSVKNLWDKGNYDELLPVAHMISPRSLSDRDLKSKLSRDMAFKSCYFETGGDLEVLLEESGYRKMPAYIPRWDVLNGDVYGSSPGMDTLPDIKQLQHQQKRKAQAIDKLVNPPMQGPSSLKGRPTTTLPGQTTYYDPLGGDQGFRPTYQIQPRINEMALDIQETQNRIEQGFYADLFKMMISSDRRNITATEVVERHEEKLVLLGPVLQRLNVELFDPLLEDVFDYAMEAGLLPEPPEALYEAELEVEYISLLAQAQQAVSASSLERTLGFAGNMAAVFPDVLDNIDSDVAIREYSDTIGTSPTVMRDADAVAELRRKRAEQQAQAQQQEEAMIGAQSAKVLSETDTQSPNALTDLISRGASI